MRALKSGWRKSPSCETIAVNSTSICLLTSRQSRPWQTLTLTLRLPSLRQMLPVDSDSSIINTQDHISEYVLLRRLLHPVIQFLWYNTKTSSLTSSIPIGTDRNSACSRYAIAWCKSWINICQAWTNWFVSPYQALMYHYIVSLCVCSEKQ